MKNILIYLSIVSCVAIFSCSKTETPNLTSSPGNGGGGGGNPPPAPTGTAVATSSSIQYGVKDTINYSFTNANTVWIDNTLMTSVSGSYIIASLYSTTTFVVKAQGAGGTLYIQVTITVGLDPRIALLTSGVFKRDSFMARPVDSTSAAWGSVPPGCNSYTFQYTNQTGVAQSAPPYSPPGNPQVTTNGPCTANPGATTTYGWGFYPSGQVMTMNGITFTAILYWHGLWFDQFIITYDPITQLPNGFKIHDYGPLFWVVNGQLTLVIGEYWEVYTK